MSLNLGATDYYNSEQERMQDAGLLLTKNQFAGAAYLGGRAVEGMLRALLWKNDIDLRTGRKSLDTGHDLREMLLLIRNLGILPAGSSVLDESVQRIGRLWFNNMRFVSMKRLESHWRERGEVRGKRTLKIVAQAFYDECSTVVKRCEVLYGKA